MDKQCAALSCSIAFDDLKSDVLMLHSHAVAWKAYFSSFLTLASVPISTNSVMQTQAQHAQSKLQTQTVALALTTEQWASMKKRIWQYKEHYRMYVASVAPSTPPSGDSSSSSSSSYSSSTISSTSSNPTYALPLPLPSSIRQREHWLMLREQQQETFDSIIAFLRKQYWIANCSISRDDFLFALTSALQVASSLSLIVSEEVHIPAVMNIADLTNVQDSIAFCESMGVRIKAKKEETKRWVRKAVPITKHQHSPKVEE